MDDEEDLHRFGTPLEPLAKDEVPVKKPVTVEDQIVKDENGRRRFHGAFTGGFSAGFWNTVGSLEGWSPQSFKSSREERAEQRTQQRPEDFMDQEDLGEFGIAPQGIRTREEFSKDDNAGSRKRKLMQPSDGPIPGVPVLEQLYKPVGDKVAVRILKSMGWKPGQGVGPRQTHKEKKQSRARNKREEYLKQHYGCSEEDGLRTNTNDANSDDDEENSGSEEEITFAPDDFEQIFFTVKDNRFGMSYTGLSRAPVLSKGSDIASTSQHINLFGPLEVMDKNKKLSIKGQAFGVGVFEQEDEDIYAREDLTRYDFSLAGDGKPKAKKVKHIQERNVIEGFSEEKANTIYNEPFTIDLPRDFKPRNWAVRKSRFEPMDPTRLLELEAKNEYKKVGLGRHDLDPDKRAQLLGEEVAKPEEEAKTEAEKVSEEKVEVEIKNNKANDRAKQLLDRINATSNNFTSGGLITEKGEEKSTKTPEVVANVEVLSDVQSDNAKLLEKAAAKTKHLESCIPSGGFKPFINDAAKQKRYEQFIASNLKVESEILKYLNERQPVTLSPWDREKEMKEFIQARNIYKPLGGIMSDRFVTETVVQEPDEKKEVIPVPVVKKKAVLKRSKSSWKPSAILCKRYNIAEPYGGTLPDSEKSIKKKSKLSVFNYLEASVNTKDNFKTPVILPKHVDAESKAKQLESLNAAESAEKVLESPNQTNQNEVTHAITTAATTTTTTTTTTTLRRSKVEVKTKKFIPKTDLEKQVEESKNKPISEKVDLFKLIFDNNDSKDLPQLAPKIKKPVTKEDHLVEFCLQMNLPPPKGLKGAAAENVLRNNSPPRGIFAALAKPIEKLQKPEERKIPSKPKIPYKTRAERSQIEEGLKTIALSPIGDGLYGPKPPRILNPPVRMEESEIIMKLQQLRKTPITAIHQKKDDKSFKKEQWIEKQLDTNDSESDSSVTNSSNSDNTSSDRHHKRKKLTKKSKKKKSFSGKVKKEKKKKSKRKSKKCHDIKTSSSSSLSHNKSHKKKSKH